MKEETRQEVRKQIQTYFRQLNVMFFVFLAGVILFLISVVIVVGINGPMNPRYNTFLYIFAPISSAALMRLALSVSSVPNCEFEHSAILGSTPNRRMWRAVDITDVAIC